jgi:hypothetical protein
MMTTAQGLSATVKRSQPPSPATPPAEPRRRRLSAAVRANAHPRRHRWLLEDAEHLEAGVLIQRLPLEERRTRPVYTPPEHPGVILVNRRRGVRPWYWYAVCPMCFRRVESLHRPPGETAWRCSACYGLLPASHRHGKHEASPSRRAHRRNPTYRQRVRAERARQEATRRVEEERRDALARARDKARRVRRRRPAPEDYELIRQVAAREAELAMAEYEAEEEARRSRELRKLLVQDAAGTRAFIEAVAATGPTTRLRERAAKMLG